MHPMCTHRETITARLVYNITQSFVFLAHNMPKLYVLLYSNNYQMSRLVRKPTMWFPNRSDTNRPVQAQKRARSLKLKFWIEVEEELYYPNIENKGADQLRGYREADLRLCFRICRLLVFPCAGSNNKQ